MKKILPILLVLTFIAALAYSQTDVKTKTNEFLLMYNDLYQKMFTVVSEAYWQSGTDVTDAHTGERIGADKAYSAFQGSPYFLDQSRELLKSSDQLDPVPVRQLQKVLYLGAHSPGTIPHVVNERVSAEAKQSATLDGFVFCMEKQGDQCAQPITVNQIDDLLRESRNLVERKKVWEVSKQSGIGLRPGLV